MNKKNHIPQFGIPEDYFNHFEDRLFSRINEENLPKTSGFRVPSEYFENFEKRIDLRLSSEKRNKVIRLNPKKYVGYVAAIAAGFLLIFSLFKSPVSEADITTINLSAIDDYIDDGNLDMDLYELTNYLKEIDDFDPEFESILISDQAIEEYLFENLENDFWLYGGID